MGKDKKVPLSDLADLEAGLIEEPMRKKKKKKKKSTKKKSSEDSSSVCCSTTKCFLGCLCFPCIQTVKMCICVVFAFLILAGIIVGVIYWAVESGKAEQYAREKIESHFAGG